MIEKEEGIFRIFKLMSEKRLPIYVTILRADRI